MMSNRGRIGLTAVVGVALALLLPSALAAACNYPTLGLSKASAGPGDGVPYTISDAQPGADYTLTIAGRVVASGTSRSSDGHSASFQMPDLGRSQTVAVELLATHAGPAEPGHEEGPWRHSRSLDFTMPVGSRAVPEHAAGPQDSPPAAGAEGAPAVAKRTPARREAKRATKRHPARARAAAAPARVAQPAAANGRSASVAAAPRRARSTPARETLRERAAAADVARPAIPGVRLTAWRAQSTEPGALLLVGLALMLGALGQCRCVWTRLRRLPPALAPPPAAPVVDRAEDTEAVAIEAELQRILAEEAADEPPVHAVS